MLARTGHESTYQHPSAISNRQPRGCLAPAAFHSSHQTEIAWARRALCSIAFHSVCDSICQHRAWCCSAKLLLIVSGPSIEHPVYTRIARAAFSAPPAHRYSNAHACTLFCVDCTLCATAFASIWTRSDITARLLGVPCVASAPAARQNRCTATS